MGFVSLDNYMQMRSTPKDLSFVGYTYKNFDAVKGLHRSFGMQLFAQKTAANSCFRMIKEP